MLTYDMLVGLSLLLFIYFSFYFFRSNDEFPLLAHTLFCTNALYRYNVVAIQKLSSYVVVAYKRDIFALNDALALEALNYFFLGNALFSLSYIGFKAMMRPVKPAPIQGELFKSFIKAKQIPIIVLFLVFLLLSFYSNIALNNLVYGQGQSNVSMGVSYFLYLPFALGGLILLMFLVYKNVSVATDSFSKLAFGGLIAFSAYTSYNPTARFSFLSWVVGLGVIYLRDRAPSRKAVLYIVGGSLAILLYSLAGLKRTPGAYALPFNQKVELAIARLVIAEDQNLLDGMMMVLQVYPENLDYQYGFQHLEILMRPIPRAIWPGKPKGGYANKLDLNYEENNGTIGISESMYGTFYGEGGVPGIILLSILYGFFFARITRYTEKFTNDIRFLLKGIMIASFLALIRGGDLAGIVAFCCMSYWPIMLFMRQYTSFASRFDGWYWKQYMAMRRMKQQNQQEMKKAEALARV